MKNELSHKSSSSFSTVVPSSALLRTHCGNSKILLPSRFSVKSISADQEPQKQQLTLAFIKAVNLDFPFQTLQIDH